MKQKITQKTQMNNGKNYIKPNIRNNTLNINIKKKFISIGLTIKNDELQEIQRCSKDSLTSELLFSIIVIEKMNRGDLITHTLEKMLVKLAPYFVVKKDLSIGLCQIRISSAKQVRNIPEGFLIRKLMNPLFSIETMSKLINLFIEKNNSEFYDIIYIINKYTTGESNPYITKELSIYQDLVEWAIKKEWFLKLYLHKTLLFKNIE